MPGTTTRKPSSLPTPASLPPARGRKSKRILLKLSGEALCAPGGFGIDGAELELIASELRDAHKEGSQLAVVVGGGNFIRGARLSKTLQINQATGDYMGMLATVINGLALKEALVHLGVDSRVMTAIDVRAVAEPFIRGRALRHLEKGRVVILVAGTGNPFFTTDTCAALRATELECDLLMKATKVDGVYTADPNKDASAKRYDTLTFAQAIANNLQVMDTAALALCRDNHIPLLVFDFKKSGNIRRAVRGEQVGTLLSE
jgi:uridylate kinase